MSNRTTRVLLNTTDKNAVERAEAIIAGLEKRLLRANEPQQHAIVKRLLGDLANILIVHAKLEPAATSEELEDVAGKGPPYSDGAQSDGTL